MFSELHSDSYKMIKLILNIFGNIFNSDSESRKKLLNEKMCQHLSDLFYRIEEKSVYDYIKIEVIREIIMVSTCVIRHFKKENLFEKCFQLFNLIHKCILIKDLQIKQYLFLAISYAGKNNANLIFDSISEMEFSDINLLINMEDFNSKFAALSLILRISSSYPSILSDLSYQQLILSLVKILDKRDEVRLIILTLKSIQKIIDYKFLFHSFFKNNGGYIVALQIITKFNFNRIIVQVILEIIYDKNDILGEESGLEEMIIKLISKILQNETSDEIILLSLEILSTIFDLEKKTKNNRISFTYLFEKEGGLQCISKLNIWDNKEIEEKACEFYEKYYYVKSID